MPSKTLRELFEKRDAAHADFEYVAETYRTAEGEAPEDWTTEYESQKASLETLDARIIEVAASERKTAEIAEARKAAGIDHADVQVTHEPKVYGEGSPNSFVLDRARASSPVFGGYEGAVERLNTYAAQVAGEMRDGNSEEGKRATRQVMETAREGSSSRDDITRRVDRARSFTFEARAGMDTTAASGGSFVTPQYYVQDYAPYRQFGRAYADAAHKLPLPDYGMTINLPHITQAAAVSAQSTQNSGISEQDPNAAYLSVALTTNAGEVTLSQQLLDRAGPNFAYDQMVFDQLTRAYNLTLDAYVLTTSVASANTVTSSYSSFAWQTLVQKLAGGKSNIEDTAGTVMPATHIWSPPSVWNFATSQIDASGGSNRPGAVPTYAGPFNAWAAGNPTALPEGDSGYRILGLPVYTDANIPQVSSNNQVLVTNQNEIWYWEGTPVTRAIPQTLAQNLSVLLQFYSYVGCIVRYPNAVQSVSGAGLAASF